MRLPTKDELMQMSNNEFREAVYEVLSDIVQLANTDHVIVTADDARRAWEVPGNPGIHVSLVAEPKEAPEAAEPELRPYIEDGVGGWEGDDE